jgi:hypothetical protein
VRGALPPEEIVSGFARVSGISGHFPIRKAIIPKLPEEPSVAIVPRSDPAPTTNILITLHSGRWFSHSRHYLTIVVKRSDEHFVV